MKLLRVNTELTKSPESAAQFIRSGGIVAFPTETVYGLGADVFDEKAIAKIFEAKQRPADNPLIIHLGTLEQFSDLVLEIPDSAQRFIDAFFPGSLTLVLKKSALVPLIVSAGLDTVGVRMPENAVANEFLQHCGIPVAAPSANISGRPSPTTWEAVFDDLNDRIDCILQGEAAAFGLESTVVDCTSANPLILRSGAVSLELLREIVPSTKMQSDHGNEIIRSPGLKHKHYAPNAKVVIVDAEFILPQTSLNAFIGIHMPSGNPHFVKMCGSVDDYAHWLFAFFRACDKRQVDTIYCQTVPEVGIGAALMDRLRRAEAR